MTEKTDNSGRDKKGRFTEGNSYGQGRPKGIATIVKELSNDYEVYLRILHDWVMDEEQTEDFRRKCIYDIMNRSAGLPTQSVEGKIGTYDIVLPKGDATQGSE